MEWQTYTLLVVFGMVVGWLVDWLMIGREMKSALNAGFIVVGERAYKLIEVTEPANKRRERNDAEA